MKNNMLRRFLSLSLCAALLLCMGAVLLPTKAEAATVTKTLADLLDEGKIKTLGRTQVHTVSNKEYLAADWPGTGFEINLTHSQDQTLKLTYRASYGCYWSVHVDGKEVQRVSYGKSSDGAMYVHVPAGTHTVSFYKDGGISDVENQYWDLYKLVYSGTLENPPAKKSLYIEFIGDSYSAGSGTLGQYSPGQAWSSNDNSVTHAFSFYTAQYLNADYSIVARGGIGLFVGLSEQEGTAQKKGMQDVYTYTSGFRTGLGEYDFSRRADVVVVELGANDSIKANDAFQTIEYWTSLLEDFTDTVREKNPTAHIVFLSHVMQKHNAMRGIVEARAESDPKLYAYYYPHNGNGSAALETQTEGHPNSDDNESLALNLSNFIATNVLPQATTPEGSYTDVVYYVSENGNDSNDGKSIEKAKKTVKAAYDAATASTLPAGSRLVLKVQGNVDYQTTNKQAFFETTKKTSDGKKLPILVTTYNYTTGGTKAVIDTHHKAQNDGNGSIAIYNDVTFKDVAIQSTTHPYTSKGTTVYYRDRTLLTGYNNVVFDNVTFQHAVGSDVPAGTATANPKGWRVSGGYFGGKIASEASGETLSVTIFRNGDYTNLDYVTAVNPNTVGSTDNNNLTSALPHTTHKLIIEEGAHMSTVYNRAGKLSPGSTTVEIRGGIVNQYIGTGNGTSTSSFAISGDMNFVMTGGTVKGNRFVTTGNYVTLDGNLTNTISGGTIHIVPASTSSQLYGFMFAGSERVTVNNVTNNISGGQFILESKNTYVDSEGATKNVDAGFYFGGASNASVQNATNNISGGVFVFRKGTTNAGHSGFYFGQHSGKIHGTLTNNISGGIFDNTNAGVDGSIYFGGRATSTAIGKIVNVIGVKGTDKGPRFLSAKDSSILLGSSWGQTGITGTNAGVRDYLPDPATDCTDTAVIENTIHGGYFQRDVIFSTNGATHTSTTGKIYYCFTKGSVVNNIYGGNFRGAIYGCGYSPVYGKVTTNIYGGVFTNIYGARNGSVYDGVEMNIFGMKEYWYLNSSYKLYAGGEGGTISARTAGRPALALNITPENTALLTLCMPIYATGSGGTIDGATSVKVTGGTFPQGFAIGGKTVGECLASGKNLFANPSGAKVAYNSSDTSVTGSVIVANDGPSYQNELVYYISEDGSDLELGHTPATAKASLAAAYAQVLLDQRSATHFPKGTSFTFYVTGEVLNNIGNTQVLGGGQAFFDGPGSEHCPVTITTAPGQPRATIIVDYHTVNAGNGSSYIVNDNTFKNINIHSKTNLATGFVMNSLYAAGCKLTLDDVTLTTDGKATNNANQWHVTADHFGTGGFNPLKEDYQPHMGTLIFKNGDYTNVTASAVKSNNIYQTSGSVVNNPQMFCTLIIDEGAQMGTVYNIYGQNKVGSATVEIRGGNVESYIGTVSGTDEASKAYSTEMTTIVSGGTVESYVGTGDYVTFTGNITNTLSGGVITGNRYSALGNNVTLTGNLTNNISGGKLEIQPLDTGNSEDGIWFSGRDAVTITGNVENNISGGQVGNHFTTTNNGAAIKGGIWMGTRNSGKINGNLTNNISGGTFYATYASGVSKGTCVFYGGCFVGGISGDLTNNISGGTFNQKLNNVQLSSQGIDTYAGKITNTIGSQADGSGPVFDTTGNVHLYSGLGRNGVSSNVSALPTGNSDTVVVSGTIYGGTFNDPLYCSQNATGSNASKTYVKGSATVDIYGGTFNNTVYLTGGTGIYGNLSVNIHGGIFNSTLNDTTKDVKGAYTYNISGGSFPNGMNLAGSYINTALAENHCVVDTATSAALTLAGDALTSGTDAVSVYPTDSSLRFASASLAIYSDLAVQFKVESALFGEEGFSDPYAVFCCGDKIVTVRDYTVTGERYAFTFKDIAPQKIGDTITATIYATKDGKVYAGKTVEYSVKQYCYNMLANQNSNPIFKRLLVDLLNYGATAQQYALYKTDALINTDLTDEQKALGTQTAPNMSNEAFNLTYATVENPTVAWKSGGLYLQDRIAFRLTLEAADISGLTVKVEIGEKTFDLTQDALVPIEGASNQYYIYFDELNAAQLRDTVLFTVYRGQEAVSNTVSYSVECYAYEMQSDTETPYLADLVKAMICYGDAAKAFCP